MVLAEHLPYAGAQVWDNSFLPPHYQGVRITPGDEPVPDLRSTGARSGWPNSSSSCCATSTSGTHRAMPTT